MNPAEEIEEAYFFFRVWEDFLEDVVDIYSTAESCLLNIYCFKPGAFLKAAPSSDRTLYHYLLKFAGIPTWE